MAGRFAPSPTGELHLGNARTALLAWLWARSEGLPFVLRMEDLDLPRVRPGLAARPLAELRWLGLDWDQGPDVGGPHAPYTQSERTGLYDAAFARLQAQGAVYPCFCSRTELQAARSEASAPHGPADEGPRYPGTCAGLSSAQASERARTRAPAFRVRVAPGGVRFEDAVQGPQVYDPHAEVGDFVVRRADGIYAYQLAVVVDDAAMGMTQVLRGEDLLASTARQIGLYRLLGLTEPRFAHAPLMLGPVGEEGVAQRLSKRDRAVSLGALREDGAEAREVVARLARSCGVSGGEVGACGPGELVGGFRAGDIGRGRPATSPSPSTA